MEAIKIRVRISYETAIRHGVAQAGTTLFALTNENLVELSGAELTEFAEHAGRLSAPDARDAIELASAPVSWPVVREGLRAYLDAKRAEALRTMLAREAEVAAALARPDGDWIVETSVGVDVGRAPWFVSAFEKDARIQARLAAVRPLALAQRETARVRRVEREAQQRAEMEALAECEATAKADAEAAEQIAHASFRAFALGVPHLARGATEDYDMRRVVTDHVAEAIAAFDPKAVVLRDGTAEWRRYGWEEKAGPLPEAFKLLDAIAAHVATVACPGEMAVTVSRVLKITRTDRKLPEWDEERDPRKVRYAGVIVSLSSILVSTRAVVFSTEADDTLPQ